MFILNRLQSSRADWVEFADPTLACSATLTHPICFHIDPVRLVQSREDAPRSFLEEPGCHLAASLAAGMRLPMGALCPGRNRFQRALASRLDLKRTIVCLKHFCPFVKNIVPVLSFSCAPWDALCLLRKHWEFSTYLRYRGAQRGLSPAKGGAGRNLREARSLQKKYWRFCSSSLSFSHVFLLALISTTFDAWLRILPAWTRFYTVGVSRL